MKRATYNLLNQILFLLQLISKYYKANYQISLYSRFVKINLQNVVIIVVLYNHITIYQKFGM